MSFRTNQLVSREFDSIQLTDIWGPAFPLQWVAIALAFCGFGRLFANALVKAAPGGLAQRTFGAVLGPMAITLYHHPYTRAANVVWMLEEVGVLYQLKYLDLEAGENKRPEILALNPMGKLPILLDDKTTVTESAAIGLYLADRYALGKLAPAVDDPDRGTYLRWSLFAPSVIEPGSMAKAANWTFRESNAGFGNYESMISAMKSAIAGRKWVLGEHFSMADAIFGGTVSYMLRFKLLEPLPEFTSYSERLEQRPARQRANAINTKIAEEHGLGQ